jgi:Tol biopolymer transport system component
VPIDERSGRVLGALEPVTTPSTWSGHLSFSRDGTKLAFGALEYRSTLLRVPFDPAREAVTGPAVPILKGTRPIRDHDVSPDGQWVAFTEAGVQEDLFVARVDGTELRRLTDDGFRDRGPAWAPDGTRVAFYSDRAGDYNLWLIRPDGSGLERLTHAGNPGFPIWSPDSGRIAFGWGTWHLVDPSVPSREPLAIQPTISETEEFLPASWSARGGRIAGQVRRLDGDKMTVGIYALETRQFTRVPGNLARSDWVFPVWLADGRRLLVRRSDGLAVVDSESGSGRLIISVGGDAIGRNFGVSRDNRWITYTETATEGSVWVATLAVPSREPAR